MKLDKHVPSEWLHARVQVFIRCEHRPTFQYEGRVIDKNAKNTRVLVMPLKANKFSLAKWIEAEKVECLEVGN